MDNQRFTWLRRDYLLMPSLIRENCSGCAFHHEASAKCPGDGVGKKYCYSADEHGEFLEDHIVIRDEPGYIAEYVKARLGIDDEFDET